MSLVADNDRPPLRRCPHARASTDVEWLAAASQQVAHDAAVTRQPPERLMSDRCAVEQLAAREAVALCVELGDDVDRVPIGTGSVGRRTKVGTAGADEVEERVDSTLPCG